MKFHKITLWQAANFERDDARLGNTHEEFTCVWWRESKAEAEELIERMKNADDGKWWEQHVGPKNIQGVVTETMNGYPEITEVEIPTDKKGLLEFLKGNAHCEYDRALWFLHN